MRKINWGITVLMLLGSSSLFAASGTRSFGAPSYNPSQALTVTLTITPDATTFAFGVEETPPAGWQITNISSGVLASNGVIKFGVFAATQTLEYYNAINPNHPGPVFHVVARTLTYTATPPANATGTKIFAGKISFDGDPANKVIGGSTSIPRQGQQDVTPPTVTIVAPANGATVSGTVIVSASASDAGGVAGVQFQLDGVNLGSEDTQAPYSFSWNSAQATDGSHTLTVIARDTSGNIGTITSQVIVNNLSSSGQNSLAKGFKNIFYPLKGETLKIPDNSTITSVKVYDPKGMEITDLAHSGQNFVWDGRNKSGSLVASGRYLLVIEDGGKSRTAKVLLIK